MTRGRTTLAAGGVAVAVVALDQLAKAVVRGSVERGERVDLPLGIGIVNVRNPGVAFGFLSDGGALVVVGTALALLALVFFFVTHSGRPLVWLPTGMLLGGAAGNLVDRARDGSVTDFVKLPHFPAFNVADIAITLGVLVLIYVLERPPRPRASSAPAAAPRPDGW